MKNKTKLLLITSLLLVMSLIFVVQAAEQQGCCLDTGKGQQCVETTKTDCAGKFYTGPPYDCSNVAECKIGTCIPKQPDQPCLRNKQLAECLALGGVPDSRQIEDIEQCKSGCCIVADGLKAEILQERQCENLTKMLGFAEDKMQFLDNITSETDCKQQGAPADLGCCVLGGGKCSYGLRGSCLEGKFVPLQGGLYCKDVNECALTTEDHSDCGKFPGTETNVYWFDSQGNQEVIKDQCDYPNSLCEKTTAGKAECKSTRCTVKGSSEEMVNGSEPKVKENPINNQELLTGTSMCYNFYSAYTDYNAVYNYTIGRSTGLQNEILHCELGSITIEGLGADRQKLCVQSQEGSLHGNVKDNLWQNCSQCGQATGFLAGVRNAIGDFFAPTIGFPGGTVLAGIGGHCNKQTCEALGDCIYHADLYSNEVAVVGPASIGSCDPKYPPGLGSSQCSNCGDGGDSVWNVCTQAECYSQGDCQFQPATFGRMLWMTPLMAASLAWAERTPLIPTECLVTTTVDCLWLGKTTPACQLPKNSNFAACIGDRFSRYTLGVPIELLKTIGLNVIWEQGLSNGLFKGVSNAFDVFKFGQSLGGK